MNDLPILHPDERLDEVNERITLIQKKDGLTFGTDAYLLAAFIRPKKHARAVELGAGTGIISFLLVTRDKLASTVMAELQPEFADLCERNAAFNHLSDRAATLCVDIRDLSPARLGYECDLVYSNPPYMRTDSGLPNRSSAKNIARHETAGSISDFCLAASRLLKHGGTFACVYRPDRLADLFRGLIEAGLEPKRMTLVCADPETAPSMVLVESKKGGAPGLTVTPPLVLYGSTEKSGTRTLSEAAQRVYDTCSLYPL